MSQWRKGVALFLFCAVLSGAFMAQAGTNPCLGDCNGDRALTVEEIVKMVNVALGVEELSGCPSADRDGDGNVTIDEILIALNMALLGCYELGSCDDPSIQETEPLCALDEQTVNCDFLIAEHCL